MRIVTYDNNGNIINDVGTPKEPNKPILTQHQFRSKFTFDEKIALKSSTDVGVMVLNDDFSAAQEIDLGNADLIAGMEYFVAQGLITEERKNEILGL